MLCNIGKCRTFLQPKCAVFTSNVRFMTTLEVSTALRPFYFSVHPDLFGQYPSQRAVNENSLKHLSSFIESLQSKKSANPCKLHFYMRDIKNKQNIFRSVEIYLKEKDLRTTVLTILKTCDLSTDYVDKIPNPSEIRPSPKSPARTSEKDLTFDESDPIFGAYLLKKKIKEAKDSYTLKNWLEKNYYVALELTQLHKPLRAEVSRLKLKVSKQLDLLDIRWECGWDEKHFRGCLQSLLAMAEQHPEPMYILRDRILVFSSFTGLSLDGYIMLNSGEVRHNWLDFIKNVKQHDKLFLRIPAFERALSQVLLDVQVVRRKFMPKVLAEDYEQNLRKLTTNVSDYLSRRCFPRQWPPSLKEYKIVVESEAGPLMVSPTGQIIAPSSCPGVLLVNFITEHLNEAATRMINYQSNKHVERSLHKQCVDDLQLLSLYKDDNVTPDIMIKCCERLLQQKNDLEYLKGTHLNITHYYSILGNGTVCIPWNWNAV